MLLALTKVLTDSADGATLLCIVLAQANFVSEFMKAVFCARCESQTFRTQDLSFPRPFVPKNEKSLWRTFVPRERKFLELSFLRPFVPGTFRSQELSFPYLRALVYSSSVGVVIVYDADLNC